MGCVSYVLFERDSAAVTTVVIGARVFLPRRWRSCGDVLPVLRLSEGRPVTQREVLRRAVSLERHDQSRGGRCHYECGPPSDRLRRDD